MPEIIQTTNGNAQQRLAVLTKSLDSPNVKSRLANEIGVEQARSCYEELLTTTLSCASTFQTTVYVDGAVTDPRWLQNLPTQSQGVGDLGQRMLACFQDGANVLIGGDCPLMSENYIQQALDALGKFDVVLGPAEDGGYVLIGMNEPQPEPFQWRLLGHEGRFAPNPFTSDVARLESRLLGRSLGCRPQRGLPPLVELAQLTGK